MTAAQRDKAIRMLREIWDRREVPHIPAEELRKLTDNAVGYLLRHWTHKDRHWLAEDATDLDVLRQPNFTEPPPGGYVAASKPKVKKTGVSGNGEPITPSSSRNVGRTFKSTNGGRLTPRQAAAVGDRN